ncbi:MAG: NYN domain-containing protein [Leptospira sp.]|nr:NYN domain-containing protein [Leptospira sp.]
MKILIDSFNLIYKFPDLELCMYEDRLDEAKEGLLLLLKEANLINKDLEFVVFVDGKKVKGDYDTIQENRYGFDIYYSQEKEADDLIRMFIKENSNPNRLTLVTSDKKIIQYAKQFKVKCLTSEAYSEYLMELLGMKEMKSEDENKPEMEGWEVNKWMEEFTQHQSQTK